MKSGVRKLVVNADDFGFTRDVNQGIVEAHRNGILTATTLMAAGAFDAAAFDDAVRLARETPTLDIGCHLVLVGAPPFPATVAQLIRAVALKRVRIYEELAAQVRRILDVGIRPTHLDTHKHTHLLPPVLDAVARISEEFQIPWVRRPFDFPFTPERISVAKRAVSKAMTVARARSTRVMQAHGCRSTDHFAGFQITGHYDAASLAKLLRALPEGSTEFMCHPGLLGEGLRAAPTRLKESRERELRALTSPEVRACIEECGIQLCAFRDL
jgi:predicted glycoside hydrolase/deacetylase ChbG (UPF0249 family)